MGERVYDGEEGKHIEGFAATDNPSASTSQIYVAVGVPKSHTKIKKKKKKIVNDFTEISEH